MDRSFLWALTHPVVGLSRSPMADEVVIGRPSSGKRRHRSGNNTWVCRRIVSPEGFRWWWNSETGAGWSALVVGPCQESNLGSTGYPTSGRLPCARILGVHEERTMVDPV